MQPLSLTENPHFADLIRHIDPLLTLPSRGIMTQSILPQLYTVVTTSIRILSNIHKRSCKCLAELRDNCMG